MNTSRELQLTLSNDMDKIRSVDVTYSNGQMVTGFITRIRHPFEVVLCLHEVPRGANPNHYLNFDRAERIQLTYHSGEVKSY